MRYSTCFLNGGGISCFTGWHINYWRQDVKLKFIQPENVGGSVVERIASGRYVGCCKNDFAPLLVLNGAFKNIRPTTRWIKLNFQPNHIHTVSKIGKYAHSIGFDWFIKRKDYRIAPSHHTRVI